MRKFLLLILLFFATSIAAQRIDHQAMFDAYLRQDMNTWGKHLAEYTRMPSLTNSEKLALCNYLYGYVAAILNDTEKANVEEWISIWEGLLSDLEEHKIEPATTHVFRSSIAAYRTKLYPIKTVTYARESMNEMDAALKVDPQNPLALGLKGNMKFYLPSIMGGSKKEAIEWFEKALKQFASSKKTYYQWNEQATWLCLAQAYEKTGDKERAIVECKKMLQIAPGNTYVSKTYLPALQKGKTIEQPKHSF